MKKICFFIGSMNRGGAERVISLLANHYADKGWDTSIVMLLHSEVGYELNPAIRIQDISNDQKLPVLRLPALTLACRRLLKQEKPDAAVAFTSVICAIVGSAAAGLGLRIIASERNDPAHDRRFLPFRMVLNATYAHCAGTVFQTERARRCFPAFVARNSVIIPNPVQTTVQAADRKRPRIVNIGKLEKQKNQRMLLDAFGLLAESYPAYILDIYGEGSLRAELQQQIDAMGLHERAKLRGNVPDVHREIADAEVFVLSSDYEGLSNALIEAMMMGLPCVSTDCAGSDEAIVNGESGLLVPVGDAGMLSRAMELLITDRLLAGRLAENGKKSAEPYRTERVVREWENVIEGGCEKRICG